jgi:hypothetical protein
MAHTATLVDFRHLAGKRCLILGGRQSAFELVSSRLILYSAPDGRMWSFSSSVLMSFACLAKLLARRGIQFRFVHSRC